MSKLKIYVRAIAIPLLVGVIIGAITSGAIEYNTLKQPSFAPPSILFPIVWTILYTLMGVSYAIIESNSELDQGSKLIYYLQLIVNALWSIFFFSLEWRLFAFFWILLLIVLVVIMIVKFYNQNKIAGLLQIPYLIWLLFAAYLNLSIYILNR